MRGAEDLARRAAVVGRGRGILGGPFEQHRVVRALGRASRREVRRRRGVGRVDVGVELAEAARAALIELRMEREALKAALGVLELTPMVQFAALMSRYGVTVLPS